MPLKFLFDEHLRGITFTLVRRHNLVSVDRLDVVCVGDPGCPPRGSPDPTLLVWAEANDRILVSRDQNTMPGHLRNHLAAGHHSPGVLILRVRPFAMILEYIACIAHATEASEWIDRAVFIPE